MKTSDAAAKDDRAEAVPLRFVEKRAAGRERLGELASIGSIGGSIAKDMTAGNW